MKLVYKLAFGVLKKSGDIEYPHVLFEVVASTSRMDLFIRALEEQTGTCLIFEEEEILEPYFHQTIMDL